MSVPVLPYFFYGTLMDPDVLGIVLGHDPGPLTTAATLSGFARVRVEREPYPALVEAPGLHVEGLLMRNYAPQDDARIRYFEDFDFTIEHCSVEIGTGPETALYCGAVRNIAPTDIPWSYADWVREEKARFLKVAEIYMTGFGRLDPEAADRLWLDTVREIYGS
ncbi:gamma-glutamylcyclotransferase family protein [Nisaea sp.]|uniref:gamma-glutamylcyclotransferase family protein n=1 Tax=Nisaea sp. TaxID=2024842 RepID=UPI0032ED4B4F